jgi:predicted ATP-dependent endonuclease of OLD family
VRVFETLSQRNQVVYATHSIFMVNKNEPTRHRVIVKSADGTLVDQKPFLNNWKSVRSSLGLFFSNNFFFADATLLVEGPSDVLYVLSILKTLGHFSKIDIDLNLFSIRDGGNAKDYYAMAKLMADEGRKVVALLDGDEKGKDIKRQLEKLNENLEHKIEIICLKDNKSIEDYVPYQDLLSKAVASSCEELIRDGIRKYQRSLDSSQISEKIKQSVVVRRDSSKTLGKIFEELTNDFFDPKEKISKLQVARNYEDLAESHIAEQTATLPDCALALELANGIKEKLNLKTKEAQKRILST